MDGGRDDIELDLREMMSLQLAEVEMLTSMFPHRGELVLDDPGAPAELRSFVDGDSDYAHVNTRIGFTVQIQVCGVDDQESLECVCHLPHEYPAVCPHVFTRSRLLNRENHRQLNEALHNYMQTLERGQICVGLLIQWLEDNTKDYLDKSTCKMSAAAHNEASRGGDDKFSRLWIYSHHIYSRFKRTDILNFSKELDLTGFSMPGKPGIVCVEGCERNVDEFWHRLRRMNWKRLVIKEKVVTELNDSGANLDSLRKFPNFEEKCFEPREGKGKGCHMDLGVLYEYLKQRDCAHVFSVYFGVEGRTASND